MIFYFSATGNSRYTAEKLAEKTGDELVDIAACRKEGRFVFTLKDGENIGIVTPVYDWILPSIVEEFLNRLTFDGTVKDPYIFLVTTFGTTPGCTASLADRILKQKGLAIRAFYSVQMPDTWTPIFDLSDKEKVRKMNQKADGQIDEITEKILARQAGDFSKRRLPVIIEGPARASYEHARKTSHFTVGSECIGCGLCGRNCPVQAIRIVDKKPVWVKDQCVMCLSCLHHCPKFAIRYGKNTEKHGQYVHP
ncbi:MAG TPA: 4Fe-4S ferredoxin [Lachnospiraceae bacterium]|nr:4Fe-4S ferredoxin [Lachnospiraceae bacterium]